MKKLTPLLMLMLLACLPVEPVIEINEDLNLEGWYEANEGRHNEVGDTLIHETLNLLATGSCAYTAKFSLYHKYLPTGDTVRTGWSNYTLYYLTGGYDTCNYIQWSIDYTSPASYDYDSLFQEKLLDSDYGLTYDTCWYARQYDSLYPDPGQVIHFTWKLTDTTSSANLTDKFMWHIPRGWQVGVAPCIEYFKFIYNSVTDDTNTIITANTVDYTNDLVKFTAIDTARDTTLDTLKIVKAYDTSDSLMGSWTVNTAIGSGATAKVVLTINVDK